MLKQKSSTGRYSESLFILVDEMPTFKSGAADITKYLSENLEYPRDALVNGIGGTVYVNFIISESGAVSNVQILRGPVLR